MKKGLKISLIVLGVIFVLMVAGIVLAGFSSMVARKPAVYLYPEEDSQIQVKLDVNGKIIEDIPVYNGGWDVFVTTEGIIENQYDYLFYEAKLKEVAIPDEGWIVSYDDLDTWFEVNLDKLGLNEKEKFQFKEYWLEELGESNYYEIKLLSDEFLNENMDLIISPKPDTEIRLNFLFKPLRKQYDIVNPEIITPVRQGFTVVEWGGILIK